MRQDLLGFAVLIFAHVAQLSSATVVLKPSSMAFADLPGKFAVDVDGSGICGGLLISDPLDACSPLRNKLGSNETDRTRFALIVRGECAFKDKVQNAQNAGFHGAIVYDDRDKGKLVYMMIDSMNVTIHAVFVSKASGEKLKEHAQGKEGECCIFPFQNETAWTVLAISFISFLVILGILLIVIFAPRHWLYSRGRNQLPKSVDTKIVEALPCFTFSSASLGECHSEETCAICLESYKDAEILKVLPCQHEFHSSCVDSWLTKWGTFCPVCKHDMRTKIANPEKDLVIQLANGKYECQGFFQFIVDIHTKSTQARFISWIEETSDDIGLHCYEDISNSCCSKIPAIQRALGCKVLHMNYQLSQQGQSLMTLYCSKLTRRCPSECRSSEEPHC